MWVGIGLVLFFSLYDFIVLHIIFTFYAFVFWAIFIYTSYRLSQKYSVNSERLLKLEGPYLFTDKPIVYTYFLRRPDQDHSSTIEGNIRTILQANPHIDLMTYQDTLGITITHVEKPQPSPPQEEPPVVIEPVSVAEPKRRPGFIGSDNL
jgi:hypothetical protein